MTISDKAVRLLKPGDTIAPLWPGLPRQLVTEVKPRSGPEGRTLVRTVFGEWFAWQDEVLRFPRRDVNYDWAVSTWQPTVKQIAIGDRFPYQVGDPDDLDAMWENKGRHLQVHALHAVAGKPGVIRVVLSREGGEVYQPPVSWFVLNDTLLPPAVDVQIPVPKRLPVSKDRTITRHGPYRNVNTGNVAYFMDKRFPGRWPRHIKPYDDQGAGEMRPPNLKRTQPYTAVVEDPVTHELITKEFERYLGGKPNQEAWRSWDFMNDHPEEKHPDDMITRRDLSTE